MNGSKTFAVERMKFHLCPILWDKLESIFQTKPSTAARF